MATTTLDERQAVLEAVRALAPEFRERALEGERLGTQPADLIAKAKAAQAGNSPTLDQRARVQLAAQNAMRAGIEAVDTAFNLTGGSALYEDNPLQRCFRDLHAASQHLFYGRDALKRYAKGVLWDRAADVHALKPLASAEWERAQGVAVSASRLSSASRRCMEMSWTTMSSRPFSFVPSSIMM